MNIKFFLNKKFLMIAIPIAIAVAVMVAVCIGLVVNPSDDSASDSIGAESGEPSNPSDEAAPNETETPASDESESETQGGFPLLTYAEYIALSGAEQQEYFNQFADIDAFFAWLNAAKAEWENGQGGSDIIIGGDETPDFGDLFG